MDIYNQMSNVKRYILAELRHRMKEVIFDMAHNPEDLEDFSRYMCKRIDCLEILDYFCEVEYDGKE